jgi:hypothetical protein
MAEERETQATHTVPRPTFSVNTPDKRDIFSSKAGLLLRPKGNSKHSCLML